MASVAWEILKTVEPGTRFVASLMEVSYALINLRQALKRIPPLIEQLDTRLKNLTFFLASIHELKPKNIAIRTVFDQADSRLSETFEDFKKFCDQYNKRGAVRKFVLSINDEQFLRQCGRVIGEATQELSFSLQVSEYQIVEEQTDMLTLCLQKLKENENSNADLLNEIENSMSRGLRKVNEDSGKVVKIVEGLTGKLIGLEDHVKEIKDKMESLPRYLENVKNDDVKELWNSRHWEDSVLIDRFLKGYLEFVQSKNPGMNRKLLTILLSRTGKRLEEKLRHQLGKSNSVIFVSPADLDIPYDVSLKDLFLWSEMGWYDFYFYVWV
ncbi:hypothetical protein BKA69DRAFT_1083307 [Paraphysoderma sedebokerense]|nr:hypothetical protein BKA69DRAFT_1083307 [Paraphysoderma sedebokerense]